MKVLGQMVRTWIKISLICGLWVCGSAASRAQQQKDKTEFERKARMLRNEIRDTIEQFHSSNERMMWKKEVEKVMNMKMDLESSVETSVGTCAWMGTEADDGTRKYLSCEIPFRERSWSACTRMGATIMGHDGVMKPTTMRLPTQEEMDSCIALAKKAKRIKLEEKTQLVKTGEHVTLTKDISNNPNPWLQLMPGVSNGKMVVADYDVTLRVPVPLWWMIGGMKFEFGDYWLYDEYPEDESRAKVYKFTKDGYGVFAAPKSEKLMCRVVFETNPDSLCYVALQNLFVRVNGALDAQKAADEAERQRLWAERKEAIENVSLIHLVYTMTKATAATPNLFDYTMLLQDDAVVVLAHINKQSSEAYKTFWKGTDGAFAAKRENSKFTPLKKGVASENNIRWNVTNKFATFVPNMGAIYHFNGRTGVWAGQDHQDEFAWESPHETDGKYLCEMMDSLYLAVRTNLVGFVENIFGEEMVEGAQIMSLVPTPNSSDYDYLSNYGGFGGSENTMGFKVVSDTGCGLWYLPHLQHNWPNGSPVYEIRLLKKPDVDKKSILAKAKEYGYKVKVEKAQSASTTGKNPMGKRGMYFGGGNNRPAGGRR